MVNSREEEIKNMTFKEYAETLDIKTKEFGYCARCHQNKEEPLTKYIVVDSSFQKEIYVCPICGNEHETDIGTLRSRFFLYEQDELMGEAVRNLAREKVITPREQSKMHYLLLTSLREPFSSISITDKIGDIIEKVKCLMDEEKIEEEKKLTEKEKKWWNIF